jgi:hypothetical protein
MTDTLSLPRDGASSKPLEGLYVHDPTEHSSGLQLDNGVAE